MAQYVELSARRTAPRQIAVPFIAADVSSLINPDEFYDKLLKRSLGALFISQLIVFGVFPLFQRGLRGCRSSRSPPASRSGGFCVLVSGSALELVVASPDLI